MALNYSRTFIALKQDSPGYAISGRTLSGKCLIESRNGAGKITLSVQNVKPGANLKAYIMAVDDEGTVAVEIGRIIPDDKGKCELKWECIAHDIKKTGKPLEDFNCAGAVLNKSDGIIAPLLGFKSNELAWRRNFKIYNEANNPSLKDTNMLMEPAEEPNVGEAEALYEEPQETQTEARPEEPQEIETEARPEEPQEIETEAWPEEPQGMETEALFEEPQQVQPQNENFADTPKLLKAEELIEYSQILQTQNISEEELDLINQQAGASEELQEPLIHELEEEPYHTTEEEPYQLNKNAKSSDFFESPTDSPLQERFIKIAKQINEKIFAMESSPQSDKPKIQTFSICSRDEREEISKIFRNCPKVRPFKTTQNNLIWVRITMGELNTLPVGFRSLTKENFVALNYRKFNHLILGMSESENSEVLILGTPDVYYINNELMAKDLGFENFKCCDCGDIIEGKHGYWLRPLVLK